MLVTPDAFSEEFSVVREIGRLRRPGRSFVVRLVRHRTYGTLHVDMRWWTRRRRDDREFASKAGATLSLPEAQKLYTALDRAAAVWDPAEVARWTGESSGE